MKTPHEVVEYGSLLSDDDERALEEAQLLEHIGRGDRSSFEALHRRLSHLLFSSAYGILNNREAAEDVIQEVFVQIWEKAPSYDPSRGKAATWALTLARNKAIDSLRAAQRRIRLREQATEERQTEQHFDERDSLRDALRRERRATLQNLVATLNAEQREAIQMAFFDDQPYPQVASALGIPLGTVKARIRRGMQRLRELLLEAGDPRK